MQWYSIFLYHYFDLIISPYCGYNKNLPILPVNKKKYANSFKEASLISLISFPKKKNDYATENNRSSYFISLVKMWLHEH